MLRSTRLISKTQSESWSTKLISSTRRNIFSAALREKAQERKCLWNKRVRQLWKKRGKTGNRFSPPWNFGGKNRVHGQSPVVSVGLSDTRTRRPFSMRPLDLPEDRFKVDTKQNVQHTFFTKIVWRRHAFGALSKHRKTHKRKRGRNLVP